MLLRAVLLHMAIVGAVISLGTDQLQTTALLVAAR